MRKLFLHVGFAKCGSTSLQEALSQAPGILYPKAGRHGAEHLSLPLKMRGIDDWTRQFFDDAWVEVQHRAMMEEISSTSLNVAISSERLAALTPAQITILPELFPNFDIRIILVRRSREKYLNSTWRHAVFFHDYGHTYEAFLEKMCGFDFGNTEEKFNKVFATHIYDLDSAGFPDDLAELMETKLDFPTSNVGVPFDLAKLLQETHALLGSQSFKKVYDMRTKKTMLAVKNGEKTVKVEPISAPLF